MSTSTLILYLSPATLVLGIAGQPTPRSSHALPPLLARALRGEHVAPAPLRDELSLLLRRALARTHCSRLHLMHALLLMPDAGLPAPVRVALDAVLSEDLGLGSVTTLSASAAESLGAGGTTALCVQLCAEETSILALAHGVPLARVVLPAGTAAMEAAAALQILAALSPLVLRGAVTTEAAASSPPAAHPSISRGAALSEFAALCGAAGAGADEGSDESDLSFLSRAQQRMELAVGASAPHAGHLVLQWARWMLHGGGHAVESLGAGAPAPAVVVPAVLAQALGLPVGVTMDMPSLQVSASGAAPSVPCICCGALGVLFAQSPLPEASVLLGGCSAASALRRLLSSPALAALELSCEGGGGCAPQLGALARLCRSVVWHSLPDIGLSLGAALCEALRDCPVDARRALSSRILLSHAPAPTLLPPHAWSRGEEAGGAGAGARRLVASTAAAACLGRHWHGLAVEALLSETRALITAGGAGAAGEPPPCARYAALGGLLSSVACANAAPPPLAMWAGASAMGLLLSSRPLPQLLATAAAAAPPAAPVAAPPTAPIAAAPTAPVARAVRAQQGMEALRANMAARGQPKVTPAQVPQAPVTAPPSAPASAPAPAPPPAPAAASAAETITSRLARMQRKGAGSTGATR